MLLPFRNITGALFTEHLSPETIAQANSGQRDQIDETIAREASLALLGESPTLPLELLYRQYGRRIWVLIDAYDAPIISGHRNDSHGDAASLVRNFLGGVLKGNRHLNRVVLTGIPLVAVESIFSGLNNVDVHTILSHDYDRHFGFLEQEVVQLLHEYGLDEELDGVRDW